MEPQRQTRTDTQAEEALYGPPGVWLSRSRGSGDRALRPGNEAAGTAQASTAVNSQDTRDQRKTHAVFHIFSEFCSLTLSVAENRCVEISNPNCDVFFSCWSYWSFHHEFWISVISYLRTRIFMPCLRTDHFILKKYSSHLLLPDLLCPSYRSEFTTCIIPLYPEGLDVPLLSRSTGKESSQLSFIRK